MQNFATENDTSMVGREHRSRCQVRLVPENLYHISNGNFVAVHVVPQSSEYHTRVTQVLLIYRARVTLTKSY